MTWTLKSGWKLEDPSALLPQSRSTIAEVDGYDIETVGCGCGGRAAFDASERREIADAVIACWNRWAETGEP